jgi:hypothetical protein
MSFEEGTEFANANARLDLETSGLIGANIEEASRY